MAMLNLRYIYPDHLVDINKVSALNDIVVRAHTLSIGARTRQRQIEISADVARSSPIFCEALPLIGHRQTRN